MIRRGATEIGSAEIGRNAKKLSPRRLVSPLSPSSCSAASVSAHCSLPNHISLLRIWEKSVACPIL